MTWSIRIGPIPTKEELEPRTYHLSDGQEVRRLLSLAPTREEYADILATWNYNGKPVLEIELETRPSSEVLIKEHAELYGVVRSYGAARIRGMALSAGGAGNADVRAKIENDSFYIECTQVRAHGEFFAMLRLVEEALLQSSSDDPALAELVRQAHFSVGFADSPSRNKSQEVAAAIASAIAQHDWSQGDLKVSDPNLERYATSVTRFGGRSDRPIKCAQLISGTPVYDYVDLVLRAIETKKKKNYANGPLELAVTAIEEFGALVPRVAHIDLDPGQFRRIIVTDTQDVVVYERREETS